MAACLVRRVRGRPPALLGREGVGDMRDQRWWLCDSLPVLTSPPPLSLLAHWGVTGVTSVEVPTTGTMNETWIVRSPARSVVLRRHRRTDLALVAFEHEVIDKARSGGIP